MAQQGNEATSGMHQRIVFFEFMASTRYFQRDLDMMKTQTASMVAGIKQAVTGMSAETSAAIEKMTAKLVAAKETEAAKVKETYDKQAILLAQQTAAYDASYKRMVSAAAAAYEQAYAADKVFTDKFIADAEKRRAAAEAAAWAGGGSIPQRAATAGMANIGSGIAVAAALQQSQDVAAAKEAELLRVMALANEERAGEIRLAQETAAGVVAAAEAQRDAVIAAMEEQRVALMSSASGISGIMARLSGVFSAFASAIPLLGGALLGFGGILYILYQVINSTGKAVAQWATTIQEAAIATGMSNGAVQVYIEGLEKFGVSNMIALTFMTRFTKALQEHRAALANLGITGVDVGNKYQKMWNDAMGTGVVQLNATDIAMAQFADGMQKSADKTAFLSEVIGGTIKSGAAQDIIAFFDRGAKGAADFGHAMESSGFWLSDTTIKMGVMASAIQDELSQSFEGFKMRLGAAVLPDLEAFQLIMISLLNPIHDVSKSVNDTSSAVMGLTVWIGKAMGMLIGFIGGLLGVTKKDLHDALDTAANDLNITADHADIAAQAALSLKNQLAALQQESKNMQTSTRLQTEAIDLQITAIQRNQKAFDDSVSAKLDGMRIQKTAFDDQLKQYEDQLRLQDDLHQSYLRQLQDQLDALRSSIDSRRKSGEDLVSYEERLAQNQLTKQITAEQEKRTLAHDTAQAQSDAMQKNIDELSVYVTATKDAFDKTSQNQLNSLEDQKRNLQNNLSQEEAANQAAQQRIQDEMNGTADTTKATFTGTVADIKKAMHEALDAINTQVDGALTEGQKVHDGLAALFAGDWSGVAGAASKLGQDFMDGVGSGILSGLNRMPTAAKVAMGVLVGARFGGPYGALFGAAVGLSMSGDQGGTLAGPVDPNNPNDPSLWGPLGQNTGPSFFGITPAGVKDAAGAIYGAIDSLLGKIGWPGSADGNVFNSPTLTWVGEAYEPEAIVPLSRPAKAAEILQRVGLAGNGKGGGGNTFHTTFTGPVATSAVAGIVINRLAKEAKQKGLMMSGTG